MRVFDLQGCRRAALVALVPALLASTTTRPAVAADQLSLGGALGATCLGFGCNPYQQPDFNGLDAASAPASSMPYAEFLDAVKAKKVEGVVFYPPAGDEAYALLKDGRSVRVGEGWPIEVSNSWSSPTWVMRILQNEGVPYTWKFDLKAKNSYKTRMAQGPQQYVPAPTQVQGAPTWVDTPPTVGPAPKMYEGAEQTRARLSK
jgi:hypothetical protein